MNKKAADTYRRRLKHLDFIRKCYHRFVRPDQNTWISGMWSKDLRQIEGRIKRSGLGLPYCEQCNVQEHDGNAPI